jgi:hypothetical protein
MRVEDMPKQAPWGRVARYYFTRAAERESRMRIDDVRVTLKLRKQENDPDGPVVAGTDSGNYGDDEVPWRVRVVWEKSGNIDATFWVDNEEVHRVRMEQPDTIPASGIGEPDVNQAINMIEQICSWELIRLLTHYVTAPGGRQVGEKTPFKADGRLLTDRIRVVGDLPWWVMKLLRKSDVVNLVASKAVKEQWTYERLFQELATCLSECLSSFRGDIESAANRLIEERTMDMTPVDDTKAKAAGLMKQALNVLHLKLVKLR